MQEQAAPPRFAGDCPIPFNIPEKYIPRDKFVRTAINAKLPSASEQATLNLRNGVYTGKFPNLILDLKDKELIDLAGPNLEKFDDIDCKNVSCTCKNKPAYERLFGETSSEPEVILYNNCKRTIFAAAKRQMKSAPCPDAAVVEDFLTFAKKKIDELIGSDLDDFGYSFNQWMNHLPLDKQKRMLAVHEYIFGTDPTKPHYNGTIDPARFHYEGICKVELQPIDGKPRMVCSIPDLMKYIMGPVCWKLEEICQDKIPVYCGGMNLTEMSDKINHYIDDGFEIVAEGDGSAFDNTQHYALKALDRYIYNRIADKVHHVPRKLFEYAANQPYKVMDIALVQDCKKINILTYAILGTVFSGDCDTTLMNTLRMGFYNWYTNEKAGLKINQDFVAFAKGDDFTVMYHIKHHALDVYNTVYKPLWLGKHSGCGIDNRVYGLGQILKFIETGPPTIIKFCSLRAWYTDEASGHIYLTRDVNKFMYLSKYSRKVLHMSCNDAAAYCLSQAEALEVSYPGIEYCIKMAKCYRLAANRYSSTSHVAIPKAIKDRRNTYPLESLRNCDGFSYVPRRTATFIRAGLTYWDSVKLSERAHSLTLDKKSAYEVNKQIAAEFPIGDLNMLVGANA